MTTTERKDNTTPLAELTVHLIDGSFYELTERYVAKHGGKWHATRNKAGELQTLDLELPEGTRSIFISADERYERYIVTFPDDSIFYWNIERASRKNQIVVPYVYLV